MALGETGLLWWQAANLPWRKKCRKSVCITMRIRKEVSTKYFTIFHNLLTITISHTVFEWLFIMLIMFIGVLIFSYVWNKKMQILWKLQRISLTPLWLAAPLTVSTNSNFFLSCTSWMRHTYSNAARAKSRCSISSVASACNQKNRKGWLYEICEHD